MKNACQGRGLDYIITIVLEWGRSSHANWDRMRMNVELNDICAKYDPVHFGPYNVIWPNKYSIDEVIRVNRGPLKADGALHNPSLTLSRLTRS